MKQIILKIKKRTPIIGNGKHYNKAKLKFMLISIFMQYKYILLIFILALILDNFNIYTKLLYLVVLIIISLDSFNGKEKLSNLNIQYIRSGLHKYLVFFLLVLLTTTGLLYLFDFSILNTVYCEGSDTDTDSDSDSDSLGNEDSNLENSSVVTEKLNELLDALDRINNANAIDSYESSFNSFIPNFNFNKFYEFLDSLSFIQELAFLHIMLFIVLLCIVFNILAIFFSNEIIKYFKLKSKFPSLNTFFKLRNTHQRYYLMWNIFLMFIICFAAIYIDLLTIFINP